MAVIGTFSSFTTARLAIYASQASLNVTGNNIANINTEGYTRQRMDLVSLYSYGSAKFKNIYNTNIGYGVLTNGATQLRDPYLDIRYRDENSLLEQNSEWLNGLDQMSRILDEVGRGDEGFGVIEAQLGNLKDALQKLAGQESFTEPDTLVRAEAETLAKYFNLAAKDLQSIRDNKVEELGDGIEEVNKLLTDIRDLNDKIRTQSIYGDKALELRDARNLALDKLSGYMKIDVTYSMERIDQFTEIEKLTVTIADSKGPDGKPIKLVDGIYGGQISIQNKEPAMNPNADALKIYEAQEEARKQAETIDPFDGAVWQEKVKNKKDEYAAKAKQEAEAANAPDSDYWKARLEEVTKTLSDAAKKKAIKDNPVVDGDPDKTQAAQDQAVAKAVAEAETAAKEQVDKERQEVIDTAVRRAEIRAENDVKAEWQASIDQKVADAIEPVVKQFGKYLLKDGTTATNDLYQKNADGTYVIGDDGKYVYNDEVKLYNNDKFLLQVEPLKDERDRLMVDPYTASKRSETVELNDTLLVGKLQAVRELLTEEGEYASKQDLGRTDEGRLSDDPNAAIKRGIPYYQKALDTLAQQIAKQFNEMNQLAPEVLYQSDGQTLDADGNITDCTFLSSTDPRTAVQTADGKEVSKSRMDNLQKEMDEKKAEMDELMTYPRTPYVSEEEAAEKMETLQKEWDDANAELLACKQALQDNGLKDPLYEYYDGGVLFSNNGNTNDPSNITAANISIAIDWAEGPVRVLRTKQPDSYDENGNVIKHSSRADNITHMISQYAKQLDYYAQDVQPDAEQSNAMFKGTFQEVFTAISAKLGGDTYVTGSKVDSYTLMTLDLENDRQSVSGVDLNEEATSMMQFSKSYAAACKLLTTLDSMLDKLINGTI